MENKRTRGNFNVMYRLVGLVRPLAPVMVCAVLLGVAGFLCAIFIPVLGVYALLDSLHFSVPVVLKTACILLPILAVARGVLHYAEQGCNHFIAFKLLALIRDKVFGVLRQLAPAKLEGRDKGDLIAVLTADIELLEVFYAHTMHPRWGCTRRWPMRSSASAYPWQPPEVRANRARASARSSAR